ncbi:MAG TPA: peptide chain release factor 1 [Rhodanobacteraceae bacterium]|nr:peptide chain release factor 1 [Rhodanobacteraceae bacterium]
MQPTIRRKLEQLAERHQELEHLLASAEVLNDPKRLRDISKEHSQLSPLTTALRDYDENGSALESARAMLEDPELKALALDEIASLETERVQLERDLNVLLIPKDERDEANLFLELRAGTGGDEAAIFAGDLFRMYARYAERRGWRVEILSTSDGEHGGYKEIIARIEGKGAFSRLKFESGTHRVQRVPETEAQGRIHTSAATVAILPEVDEIDDVEIRDADLKVDTFRSSGAGGQHVNKTDSAIRITHLPTGIVVECQNERSQHANRDRALKRLKAELLEREREKQNQVEAASRKLQVGSGDRSQRIRTYNFPQGRVTDHRINLTLYRLPEILAGDLDELIDALSREDQADQLQRVTGAV